MQASRADMRTVRGFTRRMPHTCCPLTISSNREGTEDSQILCRYIMVSVRHRRFSRTYVVTSILVFSLMLIALCSGRSTGGAIQGYSLASQVQGRRKRLRAGMCRSAGQGLRSHRYRQGMEQ